MELCSEEAVKRVWQGAIPLQIHLHESEVTSLPPPPPVLVLGPRIGYLPLLVPLIKAHFSSSLPPGNDTIWFDYRGLPLKWYIPTGVLFDLLCAEPERPWNLTVHFRGHAGEILAPCEGEDSVERSYINSLKEAAYIINGNCKNVMNMSQADRVDLWQSLLRGNMDGYLNISSKLKLGPVGDDCLMRTSSSLAQHQQANAEPESVGSGRQSLCADAVGLCGSQMALCPRCKMNINNSNFQDILFSAFRRTKSSFTHEIPVRLYVRSAGESLDDLEDAPAVDSWERVSYINRPYEFRKDEGNYITLKHAMKCLLPEIFGDESLFGDYDSMIRKEPKDSISEDSEIINAPKSSQAEEISSRKQSEVHSPKKAKVKLIRVQGIELDMNIPFFWVVNNLKNPEYFLHICVFVGLSSEPKSR